MEKSDVVEFVKRLDSRKGTRLVLGDTGPLSLHTLDSRPSDTQCPRVPEPQGPEWTGEGMTWSQGYFCYNDSHHSRGGGQFPDRQNDVPSRRGHFDLSRWFSRHWILSFPFSDTLERQWGS